MFAFGAKSAKRDTGKLPVTNVRNWPRLPVRGQRRQQPFGWRQLPWHACALTHQNCYPSSTSRPTVDCRSSRLGVTKLSSESSSCPVPVWAISRATRARGAHQRHNTLRTNSRELLKPFASATFTVNLIWPGEAGVPPIWPTSVWPATVPSVRPESDPFTTAHL